MQHKKCIECKVLFGDGSLGPFCSESCRETNTNIKRFKIVAIVGGSVLAFMFTLGMGTIVGTKYMDLVAKHPHHFSLTSEPDYPDAILERVMSEEEDD